MTKTVGGVLVITLLLAAAVLAQQSGGRGAGGGRPSGSAGSSPVALAEVSEQSHSITVGGRLEPQTRIVHKIPTGGYVLSVAVLEGQLVEAGDELLTIKRKDDVMELYKSVPLGARITGRVSEVLVQEDAEVAAGEAAVVVLGTEGYLLRANVSDKDAFKIEVGQRVRGRGSGGTVVAGFLYSRSQEPDYSTGLFELTFQFPNSQRISIGEFVLIDLPIDRARGLFIPRDAVVRRYGKYFIWIVNQAKTLQAREVALGPVYGDLVLIREGLEAGEGYLQRPSGREREGAPVAGSSGQ
jgi:multidrug efflux pump subunit AcrA (membrane-fusion protein)